MRVDSFELFELELPLVRPFRTSFGTEYGRNVLLIKANTSAGVGWGECVAGRDPLYSAEYVNGAIDVITKYLAPTLLAASDLVAADVSKLLKAIRNNPMSKAALEMAILDAELKAKKQSWANFFGATAVLVPSGVSVGIPADDKIETLLAEVQDYVDSGYVRIKLKIQPGWDLEPVRAVRNQWPEIPLQVDANQAYQRSDIPHLQKLDEFNLLLIEQPLAEEDLLGHAQMAAKLKTPICLDESIVSFETAEQALDLHACQIINIKPGRVGGYIEAKRIHDLCLERGVPVWAGGMLETGIGRAANIAMAGLTGYTVVGDISESARFYAEDVTAPFSLEAGFMRVPTQPGIGVEVNEDVISKYLVQHIEIGR
jgi:o-succinylbenzoate synthase